MANPTTNKADNLDRREFLRSGLRGALMVATGGAAGILGKRAVAAGCIGNEKCRACGAFTACSLDPAEVLRTELEDLKHGP